MSNGEKRITAAILAIGDELLSGRTRDANIHYLGQWLTERGVALAEARIVGDVEEEIVAALNQLRHQYDYVFTSGGIGPTHDDITAEAVAAAFEVPVVEHPRAIAMINAWYEARGEEVTASRRRMARAPRGAELIDNPVSGAPGVKVGNVFVMAGVPRIFQGMLNAIDQVIERGVQLHARAATAIGLPESKIADALRRIQETQKGVAIGSYPIDGDEKGVTIIARSANEKSADAAIETVRDAMRALGFEPKWKIGAAIRAARCEVASRANLDLLRHIFTRRVDAKLGKTRREMTRNSKAFKIKGLAALFVATAFVAAPVGGALANGGGGGGALPAPAPGPQVDPAQSYQEGVTALQAGDYKTAEKKFGEVLSVVRDHAEANYYMGLAKVGRGKESSSVRYFKRAIRERSDFVEAREQLALVYIKTDKASKAEKELAAIKDLKESCASDGCGSAYLARIDEAIAKVEAALGSNGGADEVSAAPGAERVALLSTAPAEAGEARYGDAVRLINQERFDEAIVVLEEAQEIYGPHPDILNYLGFANRKAGDFDAARTYYAQALTVDPNHLGATEYLGELYLEIGDIERAKNQLAKLERLCSFGCAEYEDLARLIDIKESRRNASN